MVSIEAASTTARRWHGHAFVTKGSLPKEELGDGGDCADRRRDRKITF